MKKILVSVAAISIVTVAALNLNLNMQKDAANLLTLANTEALATPEYSTDYSCPTPASTDCLIWTGIQWEIWKARLIKHN